MEYWVLYLCSIADSVHTLFCIIGGIPLGLTVISAIFFLIDDDVHPFETISRFKGWFTVGLIFVTIGVITPSTNKCYAIFGVGTVLEYVNNNDEAKRIPDNAMKTVNRYLESLAPNDSIR